MAKVNILKLGINILVALLKLFGLYIFSFILIVMTMSSYYEIRYHAELEGWGPGLFAMVLAIFPTVLIPMVWIMLKNNRNSKKELKFKNAPKE